MGKNVLFPGRSVAATKKSSFDVKNVQYLTSKILLTSLFSSAIVRARPFTVSNTNNAQRTATHITTSLFGTTHISSHDTRFAFISSHDKNKAVRCSPDWSVYRCIERYCMTPRQRDDDNNLSVGNRNHLKLGIEPESWLQSHELGF